MTPMSLRLRLLITAPVLLLCLSACTLTNIPRTPTPPPTPIPLILPTTPPIIQPGTVITPVGGGNASTCPFTPPTWVAYTVRNGDSLGAISVAVDTALSELVTNNCLTDANSIFVDQVIYLPRLP